MSSRGIRQQRVDLVSGRDRGLSTGFADGKCACGARKTNGGFKGIVFT